jgi:hypothetical protein
VSIDFIGNRREYGGFDEPVGNTVARSLDEARIRNRSAGGDRYQRSRDDSRLGVGNGQQ